MSAQTDFAEAEELKGQGRHDEAEAKFREAVKQEPKNPKYVVALAVAVQNNEKKTQEERRKEAIELLRDITKSARFPDAFFHLALVMRADGDEAGAQEAFLDTLRADPMHKEAQAEVRKFKRREGLSAEEQAAKDKAEKAKAEREKAEKEAEEKKKQEGLGGLIRKFLGK